MRLAQALRPAKGQGQDRIGIVRLSDAVIVAVADGSGGVSGGAEAAERAIDQVTAFARKNGRASGDSWAALIARIDAMELRGQCALVISEIDERMIIGASVGDCSAFSHSLDHGTLLFASDGLVKYARRDDVARIALLDDLDHAAQSLVKLPELRSGDVPDDITVVLCRAG